MKDDWRRKYRQQDDLNLSILLLLWLRLRYRIAARRRQEEANRITKRRLRSKDGFGIAGAFAAGKSLRGRMRTVGTIERGLPDWKATQFDHWTDQDFESHTRMNRFLFVKLVSKLRPHISEGRIPVETMVAAVLYKLSGAPSDRTVGFIFGIKAGSFSAIFWKVVDAIYDHVRPTFLPGVCIERLKESMSSFADKGMSPPGLVGVIDGVHIQTLRPVEQRRSFFNYKHKYYTIGCQGICMADLQFLDFQTGFAGRNNDPDNWKKSCFGLGWQEQQGEYADTFEQLRRNNQFVLTLAEGACEVMYGPWLLADGAYPVRQNMVVPYTTRDAQTTQGKLSDEQERSNQKISGVRSSIERSYGVLKGRWGILRKGGLCYAPNTCTVVIMAWHYGWTGHLVSVLRGSLLRRCGPEYHLSEGREGGRVNRREKHIRLSLRINVIHPLPRITNEFQCNTNICF